MKESSLSQGRTVVPVDCLQMAYLFLVKKGEIEQIEREPKRMSLRWQRRKSDQLNLNHSGLGEVFILIPGSFRISQCLQIRLEITGRECKGFESSDFVLLCGDTASQSSSETAKHQRY